MKKRRKVLVIDLENGVQSYAIRFEQSLLNKSKKEILSGEFDEGVKKQLRKYRRIGAEVYIKRFPAYTTTCNEIQSLIDELKREDGWVPDDIIIDYIVLLGAISGKRDDNERISDAYIDVKNLLEKNNLIAGYTAHHTNRGAAKRFETRFETSDTAKCLDVARHVDIMLGINQNPDEEENNVMRMEYIVQRDGPQNGRCLFWVNKDHQRLREFSKSEIKDYYEQLGANEEGKPKKGKKHGDL